MLANETGFSISAYQEARSYSFLFSLKISICGEDPILTFLDRRQGTTASKLRMWIFLHDRSETSFKLGLFVTHCTDMTCKSGGLL